MTSIGFDPTVNNRSWIASSFNWIVERLASIYSKYWVMATSASSSCLLIVVLSLPILSTHSNFLPFTASLRVFNEVSYHISSAFVSSFRMVRNLWLWWFGKTHKAQSSWSVQSGSRQTCVNGSISSWCTGQIESSLELGSIFIQTSELFWGSSSKSIRKVKHKLDQYDWSMNGVNKVLEL